MIKNISHLVTLRLSDSAEIRFADKVNLKSKILEWVIIFKPGVLQLWIG